MRKACLLLIILFCNQSMVIWLFTTRQRITLTHTHDPLRLILIINIFFYHHIYLQINLLDNNCAILFNQLFIVSLKLLKYIVWL
jgi:hypothetical protein